MMGNSLVNGGCLVYLDPVPIGQRLWVEFCVKFACGVDGANFDELTRVQLDIWPPKIVGIHDAFQRLISSLSTAFETHHNGSIHQKQSVVKSFENNVIPGPGC